MFSQQVERSTVKVEISRFVGWVECTSRTLPWFEAHSPVTARLLTSSVTRRRHLRRKLRAKTGVAADALGEVIAVAVVSVPKP